MAERFTLEIVEGPGEGKRFPLSEATTTVGRHADATIVLGDGQASRQHARLDLHDGQLWIRDLGSANGTFVNGEQLRRPFALSPGDAILIGNTTLRLLDTQGGATAAPAPSPLPPAPVLEAETRMAHASGTAPTRPHHPGAMQAVAPGMTLNNRYELGEQVGQGGFARVYVANDNLLKRRIAVKVLNGDLAEAEGQSFLERFAQEAQSIASLDHPNILGIHDFGEALGTVYLVMPYVEGGTLIQQLRSRGKFDPVAAGEYLRQAAAALDYAHRRNLVHRDIKPQNMLLRADDGRLLLSDFGIAKVVSSTSAQSSTGIIGTIAYMAPEQLQGRVTTASDIYALGCVLFQMLTGQLPFTGPTEQVMFGHLSAPIPTLLERGAGDIPPGVQPVLERALAKRPEARFRTAGELAAAYDAAIAGRPPVVADPGVTELQAPPPRPLAAPPATVPMSTPFTVQPPPPGADQQRTAPLGPAPVGYYAPSSAPPPIIVPPPPSGQRPPPERTGRRALLIGGAVAGLALLGGGAGAVFLSQLGNNTATPTPSQQVGQASAVPVASPSPGASAAPPTPTNTPGVDPAVQAQAATATALAQVAQGQAATATALARVGGAQAATATAQANAANTAAQSGTATAQAAQAQSATATAQAAQGQAAQAATATAQAQGAAAGAATATAQTRAGQTATVAAQAAQKLRDAENVVKGYYDAINRRDFDTAWSLASSKVVGTDFNNWKKGYDNTLSVTLTVESSAADGSNTRVNVRLASQEKDGSTKRFAGFYTVGIESNALKMIAASIQVA